MVAQASVTYSCRKCGKEFIDRPSRARVFCSRECAGGGRKPAPTQVRNCQTCGDEFTAKSYDPRKFCSRSCFDASGRGGRKRHQRLVLTCDTCGGEFERTFPKQREREQTRTDHVRSGDFCSRECFHAPRRSDEEVQERQRRYMQEWRDKNRDHVNDYKRRAYRRAGPSDEETRDFVEILRLDPCCYCGSHEDPTIDHIIPVIQGGPNHWLNLTSACRPCNTRKKDRSLLTFLEMAHGTSGVSRPGG